MTQGILNFPLGEIALPELVLGPIKYSCGFASKLLRTASNVKIVSQEKIRVSPKIEETVSVLDNGERLIITRRKKCARPQGVDGILFEDSKGKLSWKTHRVLEENQKIVEQDGFSSISDEAATTWKDAIRYRAENNPINNPEDWGLRPPQLGALFAVGSHWSVHQHAATIIMPTGTGKTETMLATQVAHQLARLLVAVPSKALRAQTADKFLRFGLLAQLNVLDKSADTPVVGVLTGRPKTKDDLRFFKDCNVIVGTVSSLADGTAAEFLGEYPKIMDSLIVDEAHHVPARTWSALKEPFREKRLLQFTATPFRNDGKLVDGTIIYSYPLKAAQEDNYFKEIEFLPIHELDDDVADQTIAEAALAKLRSDIESGHNHLLLARCKTKDRAGEVFKIYAKIAPDLFPVLIHSELKDADERVKALRAHESKIVICVNMLGEGVDIPALKVAAIHDKHQSLAVLLQFIGRFTRKGSENLGSATVIANTADPKISSALEELYDEDADWNGLLREMSSDAAKEHAEFVRFLESSTPFELDDEALPNVSQQSLRPKFSTLFYKCADFKPKKFIEGISNRYQIVKVWLNEETRTLYFVSRSSESLRWSRGLEDIDWHLFVLHHDPEKNLLYLASTNKSSAFESLAKAVGATDQISGEEMFRTLGRIGRLVFNNLGVTKHGRRNLSFAMYTGADVKQALSETEKKGSRKSNIQGYGWENGRQITIGCSYRGRVWSKAAGNLPNFIKWAEHIGGKLIDDSIDTKSVIANVLIPEYANKLPDHEILSIDWPFELLANAEDRMTLSVNGRNYDWLDVGIEWVSIDRISKAIDFVIVHGDEYEILAEYQMIVKGEQGFDIVEKSSVSPKIIVGNKEHQVTDFLSSYPPLVRFVDLSELDGNVILQAEDAGIAALPDERLEAWDWTGIEITKESIWKKGIERRNSVQWKTAQNFIEAGYSIVFDDDGRNEAADLVCLKIEDDFIRLALVHCKFSEKSTKGGRVKDVVEVASQATRSARWPGQFPKLVRHIQYRNKTRKTAARRSLFLAGSSGELNAILKASRFKEVRPEILVVQPGISKAKVTSNQSAVLGAAVAYLKQTLNIDLDIICSD